MSFLPSVVATATMLHVVNNIEPCLHVEYQNQLLGILGIDKVCSPFNPNLQVPIFPILKHGKYEFFIQVLKLWLNLKQDKVDDCYKLVVELSSSGGHCKPSNKRKFGSIPGSPNGVIDMSFSSDSSNDSWAVASSVSSSPEPLSKKRKLSHNPNAEILSFIPR